MFGNINMSQFGTGWNQSQENMERKRVELAKAFEEFKASNPYATVQDFQSFIDMASGGSNYVRGGAPSADVLTSLAERNKTEFDKKQRMDRINEQSKLASLRDQVTPLFQNVLMSGNREGVDQRIADAYKDNKELVDMLGGKDFLTTFNQTAYDRGMFDITSKALPTIKNMIAMSGGKVDKDAISRATGISPDLLDGAIKQAQAAIQKENDTYFFNQQAELSRQLAEHISDGGDAQEWLDGFNKEGITQLTESQQSALLSRAEGIEEKRINDLKEDAQVDFNKVIAGFRTDQEIDKAMYRMDRVQLRELLKNNIMQSVVPRRLNALYPDGITDADLDRIIDTEIAARSTEQQAANELKASETRTAAVSFVDDDMEARSNAFTSSFTGSKVDPIITQAANAFAQRYYMDGVTETILTQAFADYAEKNDGKLNMQDMINFAEGELRTQHPNVMSKQDARAMKINSYQDTQGMFKVETLDQSLAGEQAAIQSFITSANSDLDNIANNHEETFASARDMMTAINELEAQVINVANASRTELNARQMNLNKWKLPGTNSDFRGWATEWEKLSEPLAPLQQQLQELKAIAQNRLDAEADAEAKKMAFTGNNRTAMNNILAGAEIGEVIEMNGQLMQVVRDRGQGSRNSGGKKLVPVPGPTRKETLEYLANGQLGDIITHNGMEYEIVQNTGRAARNQPTKLVRR